MILKLPENILNEINRLITRYPRKEAALIPVLHLVQKEYGCIPDESAVEIASALELPVTRVHDVLSFYTMFRTRPAGKRHIQVCRTLSCAGRGAPELLAYLEEQCGVACNQGVSSDGLFSIETVECLGSCATAPVMQVNDDYYENLTREKIDELIRRWKAE
jgi:NADH-quinone oxidoreductase E subunit